MIDLFARLFSRKPQRHYLTRESDQYRGLRATCRCGHSSVWDYDLRKHFEEMGRIGA